MDKNLLAIADVLRHKTLGLVSHQPDFKNELSGDKIRVRDINWIIHIISATDCEWATREERENYWEKTLGKQNVG